MPFPLRKGLKSLREEVLVKVRKRCVQPGQDVGRILIAIGVGPVVPQAGAEDSPLTVLAESRGIACMAVSVQLVYSAGLVGSEADGGAVLVELLVPVAHGVHLGIETPSVPEIGVEIDIFKIGLHVVVVIAVVIGVGSVVREKRVALEQEVVAILRHLRRRGIGGVGRVIPDVDQAAIN